MQDSVVYTDTFFKIYDGLVNLKYKKHYRAKHDKNEFATEKNHANGNENF